MRLGDSISLFFVVRPSTAFDEAWWLQIDWGIFQRGGFYLLAAAIRREKRLFFREASIKAVSHFNAPRPKRSEFSFFKRQVSQVTLESSRKNFKADSFLYRRRRSFCCNECLTSDWKQSGKNVHVMLGMAFSPYCRYFRSLRYFYVHPSFRPAA